MFDEVEDSGVVLVSSCYTFMHGVCNNRISVTQSQLNVDICQNLLSP